MFEIRLQLEEKTVTGLNALDLRRRLGLSDNSFITTNNFGTVKAEVSEGFARLHFNRDQTAATRVVTLEQVSKGDVVDFQSTSNKGTVYTLLDETMGVERIMELWLAGK